EVTEAIKGTVGRQVWFSRDPFTYGGDPSPPIGEEILVFLSMYKDDSTNRETAIRFQEPDARMHNRLTCEFGPFGAVTLGQLSKLLYNKEGHRIDKAKDLLALCRNWSSSKIKYSLDQDADWGSDVQKDLYAGSGVLLRVPAEESYSLERLP